MTTPTTSPTFMKTPAAKLPQESQIHAHHYNSCDDYVQTSLVNTAADLFTFSEDQLLTTLETIVTQHSNPAVHHLKFTSLTQSENESIENFVVTLKSLCSDCEFTCPHCNHNLQDTHPKDQLIKGLNNGTLQTDILAKANCLRTLDDIIKHAKAFASALHNQSSLDHPPDTNIAKISSYQCQQQHNKQPDKSLKPCSSCGSHNHGQPGSNDCRTKCSAWGKKGLNCTLPNHFASVSHQKLITSANALIANVNYGNTSNIFTISSNSHISKTLVTLSVLSASQPTYNTNINMKIFPDRSSHLFGWNKTLIKIEY